MGGVDRRSLPLIGARVAELPDAALAALGNDSRVAQVSQDRRTAGAMETTAATVGATVVRRNLGYDGSGVGVAVIDSGALAAHDDLMGSNGAPVIDRFVDFVGGQNGPYDDYGHGTHVAGIIAGNGYDSNGARAGIAPGVRLTVLKVLDRKGDGLISDVIAALDYVVANKDELNIRVVNLSVATGVYESYNTDPLTLAAETVVRSRCRGRGRGGQQRPRRRMDAIRHGGVTAPGNAPWVLTVGASSHMGTIDRADDTIASFSSRGPTAHRLRRETGSRRARRGDRVTQRSGEHSLFDKIAISAAGTVATSYLPYLSLSGTSMSAPVVTGTVALMLQANPSLTPNAVKAILQYTAEVTTATIRSRRAPVF